MLRKESVGAEGIRKRLSDYTGYLNETMAVLEITEPSTVRLIYEEMLVTHYFLNYIYFLTRSTAYSEDDYNTACDLVSAEALRSSSTKRQNQGSSLRLDTKAASSENLIQQST